MGACAEPDSVGSGVATGVSAGGSETGGGCVRGGNCLSWVCNCSILFLCSAL